jgi:hypothetical protein
MKQILFISTLVLLLIGCKDDEDPEPPELLINTDMEAGESMPDSWWDLERTVYTTEWTAEEASSGTKSLKISATESDATNFSFWAQSYFGEIPVGKDVVFFIKIKCKKVSGQGISIAIRGDSPSSLNGTAAQFSSTEGRVRISGDFDWTTYQVRLDEIHNDIKSLTIYVLMLNNSVGTVYFDDASLKAQ